MDAAGWNRRYDTTELLWTVEPNRCLVTETSFLAPGTALDLGAGEGRNAVWLAQQGWRVTALDFSHVGLSKAAQLTAAAGVDVHRRAAAGVAPGGTLLVLGHDTTNLTDGHGGPQDPDVLFSPDDIAADLAGSGLVLDRADRVQRTVDTADRERVAIDALVRARRPGSR